MTDPPAGRELDAAVAKVLGMSIVGNCRAWDPEGSGWSLFRPDENELGEVRPAYLNVCMCEHFAKPQSFPGEPSINRHLKNEFIEGPVKDKQLWGHVRNCLKPVPWYSTDHAAAIEALEAWRSKSPEHTWAIHRHPIGFTVELDCIIATLRKSAPTLAHAAALALVATTQ